MVKKETKTNKIDWTLIAILLGLLFLMLAFICIWWFSDSEIILQGINKTEYQQPNTILLFIDEDPSDAGNLKKVHFADIYVINGSLDADMIEDNSVYLKMLRDAISEIEQKETLPLLVEPELGLLQEIQVEKNDSDYIYAVAEYLNMFKTEIIYTNYEKDRGKLSKFECMDMEEEIDRELDSANYCETDSDCNTLPLASSYIIFGCYHYINKNENSDDFYSRMNYYDAACGEIIDMCRQSPEPKCEDKKCVEKE